MGLTTSFSQYLLVRQDLSNQRTPLQISTEIGRQGETGTPTHRQIDRQRKTDVHKDGETGEWHEERDSCPH